MKLKVLLNDPIVVHCFVKESFMLMSVVIVMKAYSGVFTVQLRFNQEHYKISHLVDITIWPGDITICHININYIKE